MFEGELRLLQAEGIAVPEVQWPDNAECIELIAARPSGILSLLDAEARTTKPSDFKFNQQVQKVHAFNPLMVMPHPKDQRSTFIVRHFAGEVRYTVGLFINKNQNKVPEEMEELFEASALGELLRRSRAAELQKQAEERGLTAEQAAEEAAQQKEQAELEAAAAEAQAEAEGPSGRRRSASTGRGRGQSVGGGGSEGLAAVFTRQMSSLVATLGETRCSFVRCVKPNARMEFGVFDRGYVSRQLRCQGVLQACEVLQVALPTRVPYADIVQTLRKQLPPQVAHQFESSMTAAQFCMAAAYAVGVPADAYRCGLRRMFFKAGQAGLLDQMLSGADDPDASPAELEERATRLTKRMKEYVLKRRWRAAVAAVKAQNVLVELLLFVRRRREVARLRLQAMFRGRKGRQQFARQQEEALQRAKAAAEEARRREEEAKRRAAEAEAERARIEAERRRAEGEARQVRDTPAL